MYVPPIASFYDWNGFKCDGRVPHVLRVGSSRRLRTRNSVSGETYESLPGPSRRNIELRMKNTTVLSESTGSRLWNVLIIGPAVVHFARRCSELRLMWTDGATNNILNTLKSKTATIRFRDGAVRTRRRRAVHVNAYHFDLQTPPPLPLSYSRCHSGLQTVLCGDRRSGGRARSVRVERTCRVDDQTAFVCRSLETHSHVAAPSL